MITVTIGQTQYSITPDSLSVKHELFKRSTCALRLPDADGSISISVGQPITITEGAYCWFAGTIAKVDATLVSGTGGRYLNIDCQDFSQIADRRVTGVPSPRTWTQQYRNNIIRDITLESLAGDNINLYDVLGEQGPLVADFKTEGESVASAFTSLCTKAQSFWRIDHTRKLIVRTYADAVAAIDKSTQQAASLSDISGHIVANSLKASESRQEYANEIFVKFSNNVETITERLEPAAGFGYTLQKPLIASPVASIGDPSDPESFKWFTVIVDGEHEFPGQEDPSYNEYWLKWSPGSNVIKVNWSLPSAMTIEYKAKGVDCVFADDPDAVAARQAVEGGSGIYSRVISVDQDTNTIAAQELAQAYLDKSLQLSKTITFETDNILADPGDKITSTMTGIDPGTYIVRSVTSRLLNTGAMRSTLEIISGQLLEDGGDFLTGHTPSLAAVGVQKELQPRIPDISGLTCTATQIEIDGVLKNSLEFSYIVPSDSPEALFDGVKVYRDDQGVRRDEGHKATPKTAGETETFTLIYDLPETDRDWTFYFPSWNRFRSNDVTYNDKTPNITVAVKAKPLEVAGVPDVINIHAGTEIGGAWTNSWYWDDLGSTMSCDWACDVPANRLNWSGVALWLRDGSGPWIQATGIETQGSGTLSGTLQLSAEFIPAAGSYQVLFCSYDREGNPEKNGQNPTGPVFTIPVPQRPAIPGGVPTPPPLSSDGWSLAIAEYSYDTVPKVRVRATVTERPNHTTIFSAWKYRGATAPAHNAGFEHENNTAITATGATYLDMWIPQESTAYTLWFAIVPNGSAKGPTATTVVKSITIPAPSASAHGAAFSVTVLTRNTGGIPEGCFQYSFSAPATNYYHMRFDRIWCDSNFVPVAGQDWHIGTAELISPQGQDKTWWNLPPTQEYWKWRMVPISPAGLPNVEGAPTFTTVVPASSGIVANLSNATGILPPEKILFQPGDNSMTNPGFEADGGSGIGWHQWGDSPTPWTFPLNHYRTGKCCAMHVGSSGYRVLANSAGFKVAAGDQFVYEAYVLSEPGCDGTIGISLLCIDKDNNIFASICDVNKTAGGYEWTRLSASGAVPSGTAIVVPIAQVVDHTTSRWFVDDFRLVRQIGGNQVRDDALGHGVGKDGGKLTSTTDNTANLISNPGFEFGLKDWSPSGSSPDVIESSGAYSGKKCLRIQPGQVGVWNERPIVVKAGEAYKCETWVSANAGSTGAFGFYVRTTADNVTPHNTPVNEANTWANPNATWQKMEVTISITTSGYLWLMLWGSPESGVFYVDSVACYKVIDASLISSVDITKAIGAGAEFAVTMEGGVPKFKLTAVDFSKAYAYDAAMFEVSGGAFKYKELDVEKLKGTVASFGGSGRAGLLAIFNSAGQLVGWDGDDRTARVGYAGTGSGFEGGWRKRFLIGGATPATAQIVFDANGNGSIGGGLITGALGATVAYLGTVYPNQIGSGTLPAGVVYAGTVYLNQLGSGTLPAGIAYVNTIMTSQIGSGALPVGVTYSGVVNASQVNAGTFNVGSGGMTFSGAGGITLAGGGGISSTVGGITAPSASFKTGGLGWDIAGGQGGGYMSGNGYVNANGGFRVNGVGGITGTYAIGTRTLYIQGGIITGVA